MLIYDISYIKCAGSEARTRSIPAWKAGAPPVMRYLRLCKQPRLTLVSQLLLRK